MAHAAYFKHVFVHDVKAMPGKLISLDFCDPTGRCWSQIARMPKRSKLTCHSKLSGTALSKSFPGKNHKKSKKQDT